ncbi:MAG: hypothetical protein V1824_02175 [archaeon]
MKKIIIFGLLLAGLLLGVVLYFTLFNASPSITPAVVMMTPGNREIIIPKDTANLVSLKNTVPQVAKKVFIGIKSIAL